MGWDADGMLIPASLYILAVILLVILLCMLASDYMEEPQREYYYEERRRQLSRREVRVPIPDRQKVVRRIKGADKAPARKKSKYRENSAAFAQNAGALLTRLSKVQSRVRTLSGCPDA